MKIGDLPKRVRGVKGHWNPAFPERREKPYDGWVGFTPTKDHPEARSSLRGTIDQQMRGGYILEYVSIALPPPKEGSRPLTKGELEIHSRAAGSLAAILKLGNEPAHLGTMISRGEFDDLQDRWDVKGDRLRWSEAYPIIEAWKIVGWPKARDVLGVEAAKRCCETQSRYLKSVSDDDRRLIDKLQIEAIELPFGGLADRYYENIIRKEHELNNRNVNGLHSLEEKNIFEDLSVVEGMSREVKIRVAHRDRRLIDALKRNRPLVCDLCKYDPATRRASPKQARAIIEGHHKNPLATGCRITRADDIMLLCPTCHREIHAGFSQFSSANAATDGTA